MIAHQGIRVADERQRPSVSIIIFCIHVMEMIRMLQQGRMVRLMKYWKALPVRRRRIMIHFVIGIHPRMMLR